MPSCAVVAGILFYASCSFYDVGADKRSREVFCVGIFLSFVGLFIFKMYWDGVTTQVAVSAAGLLLMTCVAF